jgi:LPS sulfotransferase NodH
MKCLWIATTPRSGSNYFCDLLFEGATIQNPKEILNLELLRSRGLLEDTQYLVPSLESLIAGLGYDRRRQASPVCLKVMYSQFDLARRLPGVRESIGAHPVVLLLRRDIVAQAVSLYIAEFTGQWTSYKEPARDAAALPYSFEAIERVAERIERHTALWRRTFLVAGISYLEIYYEQVIEQPVEQVNSVRRLWDLAPRIRPKAAPKPHSSQTTEINRRFIEQYRRDKLEAIFRQDACRSRSEVAER